MDKGRYLMAIETNRPRPHKLSAAEKEYLKTLVLKYSDDQGIVAPRGRDLAKDLGGRSLPVIYRTAVNLEGKGWLLRLSTHKGTDVSRRLLVIPEVEGQD